MEHSEGKPGSLLLDRVACRRGDRLLFAGVSLRLAPGEAAVVRGANGVGKSSLLRLCAGLLAPAAGRVASSGGVALDSERLALDPDRPLAAALDFWAKIDRATPAAGQAALAVCGLQALVAVPVRLLSTGQRRRAALARVASAGAGVWLLDEPANGLDAAGLVALGTLVAAHRAGGGVVLAATHTALPIPDVAELML